MQSLYIVAKGFFSRPLVVFLKLVLLFMMLDADVSYTDRTKVSAYSLLYPILHGLSFAETWLYSQEQLAMTNSSPVKVSLNSRIFALDK